VDPYPRGPDWMPITPKTGSLFHADSHPLVSRGEVAGEAGLLSTTPGMAGVAGEL